MREYWRRVKVNGEWRAACSRYCANLMEEASDEKR